MSDVCGTPTTRKMRAFPDERVFTGTWCTNKIALALTKGFRIIEIYEVWHFEKTSDTLFRDYVRGFMKLKMESSAPPDEDINVFKARVKNHLGIKLGTIQEPRDAVGCKIMLTFEQFVGEVRTKYQHGANRVRDGTC